MDTTRKLMLRLLGGGARPGAWAVTLSGSSSYITCQSDAGIDNLPDLAAGFTIEGWVKMPATTAAWKSVFGKRTTGLMLQLNATKGPYFFIDFATTDSLAQHATSIADGVFHHIACTYNAGDDKKARVYIDGTLVSAGAASDGAYVGDAASDLRLTSDIAASWGWFRVSNLVRYTANFTPTSRVTPPDSDANTLLLYKVDEGTGTALDNAEGTAGRDGIIVNGTWEYLTTNP